MLSALTSRTALSSRGERASAACRARLVRVRVRVRARVRARVRVGVRVGVRVRVRVGVRVGVRVSVSTLMLREVVPTMREMRWWIHLG